MINISISYSPKCSHSHSRLCQKCYYTKLSAAAVFTCDIIISMKTDKHLSSSKTVEMCHFCLYQMQISLLSFIACLYHRPVFSPGNLRTVSDVWCFVVCFFVPLVSALKCTSLRLSPASLQLNVSWTDTHLTCLDLLSHAVS